VGKEHTLQYDLDLLQLWRKCDYRIFSLREVAGPLVWIDIDFPHPSPIIPRSQQALGNPNRADPPSPGGTGRGRVREEAECHGRTSDHPCLYAVLSGRGTNVRQSGPGTVSTGSTAGGMNDPGMEPQGAVAPLPARSGWRVHARTWGLLLFAGVIWGTTFSLAKIATEGGAHPLGISLWQAIFGAGLLIAFDWARRRRLPCDRSHLRFYLTCGLLGTAIPGTLYFYAAPRLPAGVLALTIATVPMLTFAGALAVRLERLALGRIVGVVLGIVAVAMIALPESSLPDPDSAPWILAAVAAAASYAGENIAIAVIRPGGTDSVTLLRGMLIAAAAMLVPVVAATGTFVIPAWPPGEVELAMFGMALINVVAYGLFVSLVSFAGPVFASQMAYVVTLSGVFWGILVFAEAHSPWIWGALAVMVAGLTLVNPRRAAP
jgi:drug/metabolite transporter (DMT)-like permease